MQTLHLEVPVDDVLVDFAQVDAAPDLVCALLWNRKEGVPETVLSVWRQDFHCPNAEIVLQSLAAGLPLLRIDPVPES